MGNMKNFQKYGKYEKFQKYEKNKNTNLKKICQIKKTKNAIKFSLSNIPITSSKNCESHLPEKSWSIFHQHLFSQFHRRV